jgi:hypothetical protein
VFGASFYGPVTIDASNLTTVLPGDGTTHAIFGTGSSQATLFYNSRTTATVTCNSGADTGSITFTTKTLEPSAYTQSPPFNSAKTFNYDWPIVNPSARVPVADPMTGAPLIPITQPGWWGQSQHNKLATNWLDVASAWTNPANVISGSASTLASYTYSGTGNGAPIFIPFPQIISFTGSQIGGWAVGPTLDDIRVHIFGNGSVSGMVIEGCLTEVPAIGSCTFPASALVTLPTTLGNPAGSFPSNANWPGTVIGQACYFCDWNLTTFPTAWQLTPTASTITISGSAVTNGSTTTGLNFNVQWPAGMKYQIPSSSCTNHLCTLAAAPATSQSMTVVETPGVSSATGTSMPGLLLWVASGSAAGTANISVSFDWAFSDVFIAPAEGNTAYCTVNSQTISTMADGSTSLVPPQTGELCTFDRSGGGAQNLALFIPGTGEVRHLTPLYFFNGSDPPANQVSGFVPLIDSWDQFDPNTFDFPAKTGSALTPSIFKVVYNPTAGKFKAYGHSLYPSSDNCTGGGGCSPGQDTTQNWFQGPQWSDQNLTWTDLTPASAGLDINNQIHATNPYWDSSVFADVGTSSHPAIVDRFTNGFAVVSNGPPTGGETITLINVFNVSTGLITATDNIYSHFPQRWCANHSADASGGYYSVICNLLGGAYSFVATPSVTGVGPWQSTPYSMLKGGVFTTDTSMTTTSPLDTCPTNSFGITGNLCVTVHMPDVASHSPSTAELAKWPTPQNSAWSQIQGLAPGDALSLHAVNETLQALTVAPVTDVGCGVQCLVVTWARAQFPIWGSFNASTKNSSTGWTGYATPPGAVCCLPGVGNWFDVTKSTLTFLNDPMAFSGHFDLSPGPTPGATNYVQSLQARYNIPFTTQVGQPYSTTIGKPVFHGVGSGVSIGGSLQGYPSVHQYTAPIYDRTWMTDFNHWNPSDGLSNETATGTCPITVTLVSGIIYKVANGSACGSSTAANYKVSPPVFWAGPNLLKDVSGPSSVLSSSVPWQGCRAYLSGECVAGSSPGDSYMTVPSARLSTACVSNWYDDNYPCVYSFVPFGAMMIQQRIDFSDYTGSTLRSIGMGLMGPGRQYSFSTFIPEPTGQWAMFVCDWCSGGGRIDIWAYKLPPTPQMNYPTSPDFQQIQIKYGAGASGDTRRIRFAYSEFAPAGTTWTGSSPSNFYCTNRTDNCATDGTGATPYLFGPTTESTYNTTSYVTCSSGCTISVPKIPGFIAWIIEDLKNGSTVISQPIRSIY